MIGGNFTIVNSPADKNPAVAPSHLMLPAAPNSTIPDKDINLVLDELQAMRKEFAKLSLPQTSSSAMPSPSPRLPIISPDLLVALQQQLKDPTARFRSLQQAQAVAIAAERRHHLVAVLPTGMGKTEVALVNAQIERQAGMTTVIMVPLTLIQSQHVALASKRGLVAHKWPTDSIGDILVCLFETAGTQTFIKKMNELHQARRLARIVIDEAHYVFASESGFRESMATLANLSSIGVPLVLLTGTLPPHKVKDQLRLVGLSDAIEVRAPTSRPTIRYAIQQVAKQNDKGKTKGKADLDVEAAHAVSCLDSYFASLQPRVTDFIPNSTPETARSCVVVFCQWTELIDRIVSIKTNWLPMHSKLSQKVREDSFEKWGASHQVMIASSLLGLGFHRDNVRGSVHWELPRNMLDFVQESGRVARDGRPGFATILWSRKPSPPAEDSWGKGLLIDSLSSSECRRFRMDLFLDGGGTTCLTMPTGATSCDNCEAALAKASQVAPTHGEASVPVEYLPSSTSSNDEIRDVKTLLDMLHLRCGACFVMGRGLVVHTHIGCPKAKDARGVTHGEMKANYLQWKRKFVIPEGRNICYRCHLPQTLEYHDRERGGSGNCQFDDICTSVLYQALGWGPTRQALVDRYEMPNDEIDDALPDWGVMVGPEFLYETLAFQWICSQVMARRF